MSDRPSSLGWRHIDREAGPNERTNAVDLDQYLARRPTGIGCPRAFEARCGGAPPYPHHHIIDKADLTDSSRRRPVPAPPFLGIPRASPTVDCGCLASIF